MLFAQAQVCLFSFHVVPGCDFTHRHRPRVLYNDTYRNEEFHVLVALFLEKEQACRRIGLWTPEPAWTWALSSANLALIFQPASCHCNDRRVPESLTS
jgi:hypothetical protein